MRKDIIYTDDIIFEDGDILVDFSDAQQIEILLTAQKGQFYQNPLTGIGIIGYINSSNVNLKLKKEISEQLINNSFNIKELDVFIKNSELQIKIDAEEEG